MVSTDELLDRLQTQVAQRDLGLFDVTSSPEHKTAPRVEGIEEGLIEAGARRALARLLAQDAMSDIAAWVRIADEAGVERKRIAHLSGISRQAVYDLLG